MEHDSNEVRESTLASAPLHGQFFAELFFSSLPQFCSAPVSCISPHCRVDTVIKWP